MKIKDLFREVEHPIELFNKNGNRIYYENSNRVWEKFEYDSNGKEIYSENSNGYWEKYEYNSDGNQIYSETSEGKIVDNRPKTEITMDQIAEKFGIPVLNLKIKK